MQNHVNKLIARIKESVNSRNKGEGISKPTKSGFVRKTPWFGFKCLATIRKLQHFLNTFRKTNFGYVKKLYKHLEDK